MLTPEESALLLDLKHRLRELHVQKAKAQRSQNQPRVAELQTEIDDAQGQLEIIRQLELAK